MESLKMNLEEKNKQESKIWLRVLIYLLIICAVFVVLSLLTKAADYPTLTPYVTDFANLLTPEQEAIIG